MARERIKVRDGHPAADIGILYDFPTLSGWSAEAGASIPLEAKLLPTRRSGREHLAGRVCGETFTVRVRRPRPSPVSCRRAEFGTSRTREALQLTEDVENGGIRQAAHGARPVCAKGVTRAVNMPLNR